ncbi:uncharacterized protein LOC124285669 [Haliotis rubra]|uniref:uncharacterized protein LOC124285669 n=1 Tax=Haliotis rubra TaxID=36100 RepID=UPI001EE5BBE9|nr:uncharacterized protein LOC124285669 [Haliotis rubra]
MTSHPAAYDDDYHESVSVQAPREWASASGRAHPSSAGPLPWRYTRAHTVHSGSSAWGFREPYLLRRENDADVTSTHTTSCLHDVVIAIGIITLLSIIALAFIATVGLNNQAPVT